MRFVTKKRSRNLIYLSRFDNFANDRDGYYDFLVESMGKVGQRNGGPSSIPVNFSLLIILLSLHLARNYTVDLPGDGKIYFTQCSLFLCVYFVIINILLRINIYICVSVLYGCIYLYVSVCNCMHG